MSMKGTLKNAVNHEETHFLQFIPVKIKNQESLLAAKVTPYFTDFIQEQNDGDFTNRDHS